MRKRLLFSAHGMLLVLLLTSLFLVNADQLGDTNPSQTVQLIQDTSGLVKILNYNTIEQGENPEWKNIIKYENPDIILQVETGFIENLDPWKEELNSFFPDETPYEVVGFDGTSGTDGQAIYSRYPIKSTAVIYEVILDDGTIHDMNHPYMQAVIEIEGIDIYFFANHLSCCTSYDARMAEQEGLMNYFDELGDVPIIYGGDFNSDSPEDVGDVAPLQGSLGVEPVEMMVNASFPTAPENHIFTDTYRVLNPDRKGYTLNHQGDWASIDHFRGRIDYIFVNQYLTEYLVNSSVVTEYPEVVSASDHKPMYTWFNFKAEVDLRPPLNPQLVVLEEVSSTSTTLSWAANTEDDLFKYSIYRNGTLLSDVEGTSTTYVDDYEYNSEATYIYQVSATDRLGNEGRLSLPVIANTSSAELFAPYEITIHSYPVGGSIGLNWSISGTSVLPLDYIRVYKALNVDDTFIIDRSIFNPSHEGSTTIGVNPVADLKLKIAIGNAIGESDITAAAYISYSGEAIINDPEPDRSNTFQYGRFLSSMVSDISSPELILDLPDPSTETSTISTEATTSSASDEADSSFSLIFGVLGLMLPVLLYRTPKKSLS